MTDLPTPAKLIEREEEMEVGGYGAVAKVRGVLTSIEPTESKFGGTQIKVTLNEATILAMFKGAEPFELKEGKFTFFMSYLAAGKTSPNPRSAYNICWCKSAREAYGEKTVPSDLVGRVVTLERQIRVTGKGKDKETGQEVEFKTMDPKTGLPSQGSWCFVSEEKFDSPNVKAALVDLIVGKQPSVVARELLLSTYGKAYPQYRDALKNNTLEQLLPLKIIDGVFQKV